MRNLLAIAIAATLAGCAPLSEVNTAKVDAQLVGATSAQKEASHEAVPNWQAFFPDAQLRQLIETGLVQNRDLRVAIARIEETRAQYGLARADRWPSVDIAASGASNSTPSKFSPSGQRTESTRVDLGLSLPSYEIDLWGRVRNLTDAALSNFLASEASAKAVQLALIGDIATTYYQLLELEELAASLHSMRDNRGELFTLIEKRVEVGLASETERLQAQASVDGLVRDIAEVKRQHSLVQNMLAVLVGVPLNQLTLVEGLPLRQQADTNNFPVNTPSTRLLQRPDVQAAELALKAADANVSAARAAFLPRIILMGNWGTASDELSGLFGKGSESWSFMPQITMPLFNAGRTQANLDLAAARQVGSVAQYEKTLQVAFKEVADALVNRTGYDVQLVSQQGILVSQKERLRVSELRYNSGLGSYLEMLDAQREYQQAEQQLFGLVRAQKTAEVALFKALGGGYSDANLLDETIDSVQ